MLTNLKRNCFGTTDFDGKFKGMIKAQTFIVYPLHAGQPTETLLVQSKTRIGRIRLSDGAVALSPPRAGGSYNHHLVLATLVGTLTAEELFNLKSHVFASASGRSGTNGIIFTDNSAALEIGVTA
jgi:hypothetical protein